MLKMIYRILSYSWTSRIPYNRVLLLVAALFEMISKVSGLALPFLLKHLIDCLVDPAKLQTKTTAYFVLGYGLLWLLNPIAKTIQVTCKNVVTEKSVNLLIFDIFKHLLYLPMSYHVDKKTGSLINSLTQLRLYFSVFWDGFIWLVAPLVLEVIGAIGLISYFYGPIYGFGLLLVLVIYSVVNVMTAKYTMKSQIGLQEKLGSLSAYIADVLLNFETVKAFSNEGYELDKCSKYLEQQRRSARNSGRIMELLGLFQNCVIGIGLTSILFYAFTQIKGNVLVFSDFILLNSYVLQFSIPMTYLTYVFRDSKQAYIVLKEGLKIFDETNNILNNGKIDLSTAKEFKIQYENVAFGYNQGQRILKNISFTVLPGQKIAIVGSTGSGKSTISRLILRFFDVEEGKILINDKDIKEYTIESIRDSIAIIPQDVILFNESLYANVLYGKPDASKAEVLEAIKSAQLNDLVASLPNSYDTIVGERGIKLSGGERQRIAIARAILRKPKIYIFDEATSSLDSNTEKEIQENLERISAGVTTIIIAHRLSTIKNADKIAVIEQGAISEIDTHDSLLEKRGSYYHYWNTQMTDTSNKEVVTS